MKNQESIFEANDLNRVVFFFQCRRPGAHRAPLRLAGRRAARQAKRRPQRQSGPNFAAAARLRRPAAAAAAAAAETTPAPAAATAAAAAAAATEDAPSSAASDQSGPTPRPGKRKPILALVQLKKKHRPLKRSVPDGEKKTRVSLDSPLTSPSSKRREWRV